MLHDLLTVLNPIAALTKKFEGNKQSIFYLHASLAFLEDHLQSKYREFHDFLASNAVSRDEIDDLTSINVALESDEAVIREHHDDAGDAGGDAEPRPAYYVRSWNHMKFLRVCCLAGLRKLQQYRDRYSENMVYDWASLLHPGIKRVSSRNTMAEVKGSLLEHLDDRYPPPPAFQDDEDFESVPTEMERQRREQRQEQQRWAGYDPLDDFLHAQNDDDEVIAVDDELEVYLAIKPERDLLNKGLSNGAVIDWWRVHAEQFPRLSRLAVDILSIPSSSAEIERIFSLAGLVITSQRNRMAPYTLEAIVCLKVWARQGLFTWGDMLPVVLEA